MYLTCRVALKPNKEQETFFWECANAARFVYNFALDFKTTAYKTEGMNIRWNDIVKYIARIKYTEQYSWLVGIPSETIKYAVKDMDSAFKKFFKGAGYPKFKKKSKTIPSFYTRYDTLYSINNNHIKICGLKQPVKTYENCLIPVISNKFKTYSEIKDKESTESLGIDLGILHTAVCSDGKIYDNINKIPEMQRLKQKNKRLQQQISRKYEMNKQ